MTPDPVADSYRDLLTDAQTRSETLAAKLGRAIWLLGELGRKAGIAEADVHAFLADTDQDATSRVFKTLDSLDGLTH